MPIRTNLAIETVFFHSPIPASPAQVRRLNAIWQRQPPRNGRIVAQHTAHGLILKVAKPVVLLAVADAYWRELGRLIKRTGEPWWDVCAIVIDSKPQKRKPHAHALSVYRITAKGELHYLHSDTPEELWPEQYAVARKHSRSARTTRARSKKWQFAPDLVGIFEGPRDLSMRKPGELDKLAINRMAIASLNRVRARAAATGVDKMTPKQIIAEIKAARRVRRARRG